MVLIAFKSPSKLPDPDVQLADLWTSWAACDLGYDGWCWEHFEKQFVSLLSCEQAEHVVLLYSHDGDYKDCDCDWEAWNGNEERRERRNCNEIFSRYVKPLLLLGHTVTVIHDASGGEEITSKCASYDKLGVFCGTRDGKCWPGTLCAWLLTEADIPDQFTFSCGREYKEPPHTSTPRWSLARSRTQQIVSESDEKGDASNVNGIPV